METYYFFYLDTHGRISARSAHEYATHLEAIEAARRLAKDHDIEVWRGQDQLGLIKSPRFAGEKRIDLGTHPQPH